MAYGTHNAGALHVFDLLARAEDCGRDISGTSIPRPCDSCGRAKRLVLSSCQPNALASLIAAILECRVQAAVFRYVMLATGQDDEEFFE